LDIELQGNHGPDTKLGICPLLKARCIGERCMWWTVDYHEEKTKYNAGCALKLIAIGINDESLILGKRE